MAMNIHNPGAGLATGQRQVWGFGLDTAIDQNVYLAPGARIFYVDPNNPQAVDFGNTGRDPTVPLRTVQAAVNLCRDHQGDTIVVGANDAWLYAPQNRPIDIVESVVIPVTAGGIRIIGAAPTPWGVQWQAAADNQAALTVQAIDVLVEGFVFTEVLFNNTTGIQVEWTGLGATGENATIRHCAFMRLDYGIALDFSWYNQIHSCYFEQCAVAAVANLNVAGNAGYSFIHGNQFLRNANALVLGAAAANFIYHNRLTTPNAAAVTATALDLNGTDNQVSDNYLSCTIAQAANLAPKGAADWWINNHATDGAY
jgi:hypothetical protein